MHGRRHDVCLGGRLRPKQPGRKSQHLQQISRETVGENPVRDHPVPEVQSQPGNVASARLDLRTDSAPCYFGIRSANGHTQTNSTANNLQSLFPHHRPQLLRYCVVIRPALSPRRTTNRSLLTSPPNRMLTCVSLKIPHAVSKSHCGAPMAKHNLDPFVLGAREGRRNVEQVDAKGGVKILQKHSRRHLEAEYVLDDRTAARKSALDEVHRLRNRLLEHEVDALRE